MNTKWTRLLAIAAIIFSANCFAASKGGHAGGSGEAVKGWKTCNHEVVTGTGGIQPLIIYIYDPEPKNNTFAAQLEGKAGLTELKDKIAKFSKFKIKSDGSDSKDWPEETLKSADKGASLIMMSSDRKLVKVFDKTKSTEERSLDAMKTAVAAIVAYDEKIKVAAAEKQKEYERTHPLAPDKEKEKEKEMNDLSIKIDPKKPDPKKATKKPGDKADAMKPGEKVADGKDPKAMDKPADGKTPMKKAPADE